MRRVCAEARELFRRAAAHESGLDTAQIRLVSGVFVAPDGPPIGSYADLSSALDLHVRGGKSILEVELAPPTSKDLARVDLPDKVLGRPRFIDDLEFDGMLHVRVCGPSVPALTRKRLRWGPSRPCQALSRRRDGDSSRRHRSSRGSGHPGRSGVVGQRILVGRVEPSDPTT